MQRRVWLPGSLLVVLLQAPAQANPPREATIVQNEVEVRSGPSMTYYATSKLHAGDRVSVVEERPDGWLGITPPAGSFSWINARYLDRVAKTAAVSIPNAEVLIGSTLSNTPPTAKGAALDQGKIVTLYDLHSATSSDGTFYPIMPVINELRFIPASAIGVQTPAQSIANPSTNPMQPSANSSDASLIVRALAASSAGNYAEAEGYYAQLAQQSPEETVRTFARNQIQLLHSGNRGFAPPTTTNSNYQNSSPSTTGWTGPAQPTQPSANLASQPSPQVYDSGSGLLKHCFLQDNLWKLESDEQRPILYASGGPGINLALYVNHHVRMQGTVEYRGHLKGNFMTVTQIKVLQ